jgi:hypothetical protein
MMSVWSWAAVRLAISYIRILISKAGLKLPHIYIESERLSISYSVVTIADPVTTNPLI